MPSQVPALDLFFSRFFPLVDIGHKNFHSLFRHPELGSGSILPPTSSVRVASWMLERQSLRVKHVQQDDEG